MCPSALPRYACAAHTPVTMSRCASRISMLPSCLFRKKRKKEKLPEYLKTILDKKLKGKLTHKERISKEANEQTAEIDEWLKPLDAGYIEAEGGG